MPFLRPVTTIGLLVPLTVSEVFKFLTVYAVTCAARAFAGGSKVIIAL